MKEKFKMFYESSEQELSELWSSDETVFIFDTNILLNLYQYSQETQDEFFKILKIIEDRIWIPFHVALEYQRRRLDVIRDEKAVFRKIDDKLTSIKKSVDNNFSEFKLKARNPDLFDIEEKFKRDICSLIDNFKVEVDRVGKSQPCVRTHDEIRAKLDNLLVGKIGDEPKEDWVLQVATDGAIRYENKVPPGYQDISKDKDASKASFTHNNIKYERKFGDLIIWKQILEYLKSLDNLKNIIFITDDSKEDWWEIIDSGGDKNIGARPELKSEVYRETGVDSFKMYHTNDFLTAAKKYCGITVDDKAIEETEDLFKNSKLKDLLQEQLISLQQRYSEVLSEEALLEQRIINIQTHGKKFSNEELVDLQKKYHSSSSMESLLEAKLSNLQSRYSEASSQKESLQEQLSNSKAYNKIFSKEELYSLQNSHYEASSMKSLLEKELSDLRNSHYEASSEKASLAEQINKIHRHSEKFSDEALSNLKNKYYSVSSERVSLEEKLANIQNNYINVLTRKSSS